MDRHHARQLFTTPTVVKVSCTVEDLRLASAQSAQTHRASKFDFAEDEAVVRMLATEERGGFIVFLADAEVGADVLGFTLDWLLALHRQPHWLGQHAWMDEVEMGLRMAGHPFGNSLSHCFRGRCRGPGGVWFTEKSWVLRVLFVSKNELIRLGVALAQAMREPVLLKSVSKEEIYFVSTGTES
jgi:hypothetical protein